MKKQSLLIIGAGAAGLMAAKELSGKFDITIIEAQNRIGGRINSILWQGNMIESGAEFIHGKLPVTLKLLNRAGIKYSPVDGKMIRKENNHFIEQEDMVEGWNKLLKKMKAVKGDMTMLIFLDKFYPEEKYASFRKHIISYTEGFDLADIKYVSIKSLYKEWKAEGELNYRITGGYSLLIEYLSSKVTNKGCRLLTGKVIKEVQWRKDNVTVYTQEEESFTADKILITVPLGVLQKTGINDTSLVFTPPVDEYISAAGKIGSGAVIKSVLIFKNIFWDKEASFYFSDERVFPTWWTQSPFESPMLTGWSGGPKAAILSGQTHEMILQEALTSLAAIFNKPVKALEDELLHAEIYNWQQDNFACGGYSYETPESFSAKEILNTPVQKTVFFAGEALYSGSHPGTVEAALESGKKAAKAIKKN